MEFRNVCVLMSTYNGEKYIEEQIESILNQEGVNVYLLIRDDGSTDGTLGIIDRYVQENSNVSILKSNGNLGPGNSFMELLYHSGEYDYYAFADQDDIWKKEKLKVATDIIGECMEPTLYCSNQIIFRDGIEYGKRFNESPKLGIVNTICGNIISGCTMVFNLSLKNELSEETHRPTSDCIKKRMHDTWVMAAAEICGKVVYDHNAYIDYRIHDSNTVGLKTTKLHRLLTVLNNPLLKNGRSKLAGELLKFGSNSDDTTKVLKNFAKRQRMALITNKYIRDTCSENRVYFCCKTLIGWI